MSAVGECNINKLQPLSVIYNTGWWCRPWATGQVLSTMDHPTECW